MVEIACAAMNRGHGVCFEASRLEEGTVRSYSIDTIEKVRVLLGSEDELFFLIGADAFAELRTWHRWQDVVREVKFIVVSRPGYCYDAPPEAKVEPLDGMELITSSSSVRRCLAAGDLLLDAPPGVIEYVRSHGIYGTSQI
jgi:nicotinate-nucleotide adenylyltransferase